MLESLNVTKTVTPKPEGIIIYAKSGLGKTTWGAEAILAAKNGVMFQCGEDGLSDLTDKRITSVPKFDKILGMGNTQKELIDGWFYFKEEVLKFLMVGKHDITTVFFDNFDNLIKVNLDTYIISEFYKNNYEKANGWGGAKVVEMDMELLRIIKAFEYLQAKRGMSIILSCHGQTVNVKESTQPDYTKWTLDLPDRKDVNMRDHLINWSSATLFGTREIEMDGKKILSDKRILKTQTYSGWDAKCRYSIPETIDFSYKAFQDALKEARK